MKKWLYLIGGLTAVGILSRLPHPARDITKLEPIRAVYLYMDQGRLCVETDTGDSGSGGDLTEATADLRSHADGEIFLDTAEFLLLAPEVEITPDFYTHLRPGCKVCYTDTVPDLEAATEYLAAHLPENTLAHLRARRIPDS